MEYIIKSNVASLKRICPLIEIIHLNLLCNLYHPEVKLILVLPCENQTKYWKQQDIDVYNDIKSRADKVKVLAPHYYNGCMQKRN